MIRCTLRVRTAAPWYQISIYLWRLQLYLCPYDFAHALSSEWNDLPSSCSTPYIPHSMIFPPAKFLFIIPDPAQTLLLHEIFPDSPNQNKSLLWIFTGAALWLLRCIWFYLINFCLPHLTVSTLSTVSDTFFILVATVSHIISILWIDLDWCTISYTLVGKGEVYFG